MGLIFNTEGEMTEDKEKDSTDKEREYKTGGELDFGVNEDLKITTSQKKSGSGWLWFIAFLILIAVI